MHHANTAADISPQTLTALSARALPVCLSVGSMSLVLAIVLGVLEGDGLRALSFSYVVSFAFFLSIGLGALFFLVIQHIVRAGWSVVVRRLAELTTLAVIPLAVMFLPILIPVLLGCSPLYEWNHADVVAHDELLQKKTPYLNAGFFAIRWVVYFAVWTLIASKFFAWSRAQDSDGEVAWTERLEQWSGPAAILLALTSTFAAFDLLMSLDPHWFSTIYGVYYFAGSMVAFLATVSLGLAALRRHGLLLTSVTTEHIHDLGKLLFGFNCFWAYIAFSQYLLIWYSNIPEETNWYLKRQQHGWEWISLVLIFGHFGIPFLGMMSRDVKRNLSLLSGWSVWLLLMHWVDLYWLAVPQLSAEGPAIGLLDASCFVGCAGLFAAAWLWLAGSSPLVPARDPRLPESLAFHNI
ncbi:MAG: quinol:cytochrome C oxidoreductase [Planctomycetaceae bacterium]|nr:quinol:cytochrome C oxidoreductase [Planctomycetaceae bacterium]